MIDYRDTSTPANARAACIAGLIEGARHARPDAVIDRNGYVKQPQDNLVTGLSLSDFADDLKGGAGQELLGKFRAVHSSSALAVNAFAPLRAGNVSFDIGNHCALTVDGFERRFPTGLNGAMPPHLDVIAQNDGELVAIESKCLEYLSTKPAKFSGRYATDINDERASGAWFAEMQSLKERAASGYVRLDAAQLIKHAFGLGRLNRPVTLLYLFWEPLDAGLSPLFEQHRAEIASFAARVAGGHPRFEAMSYFELWDRWADSSNPPLRDHAAALRGRYEVPAWAWEGVDWGNGRIQTSDWLMDLIEEVDAEAGQPS